MGACAVAAGAVAAVWPLLALGSCVTRAGDSLQLVFRDPHLEEQSLTGAPVVWVLVSLMRDILSSGHHCQVAAGEGLGPW